MLLSLGSPAESFQTEARWGFASFDGSLDVVGLQGRGIFFGEAVVFGQGSSQRELTRDLPSAITLHRWEMSALFRRAGTC